MREIISLDFPIFVKWYITSQCNLRCTHCYLKDYNQVPDLDGILPIIDYLGERGVQGVVLIGGEPLTQLDLEEIVRRLVRHEISVKIVTNGLLANRERSLSLVDSGADRFQVSIEGASAADNDTIRGPDTFERILRDAVNLQRAGADVALAMTMTRQNYTRIPAVFQMLKDTGIGKIKFNAFIPIGTGSALRDVHSLTPTICREVSELISIESARRSEIHVEAGAFYQNIEVFPERERKGPTLGCGAGTSSLIINSDLTLSACDMLVENDRTSEPISSPADIGSFWREHGLFQKWRGNPDPSNKLEMSSFAGVHQNGCHVAYRSYGQNIFRYGCK